MVDIKYTEHNSTSYVFLTKENILLVHKKDGFTEKEALDNCINKFLYELSPEHIVINSKINKIAEVKALCNRLIEAEYKPYKQRNINELQGYTAEDKTAMWDYINSKRYRSNVIEAEIEALTTLEEVNNYEITF